MPPAGRTAFAGAFVILAGLAAPALAAPVAIPGVPLSVYVGDRGQLQAFRDSGERGIYFAPTETVGDAGFFLAFPDAAPADLAGRVYGFRGVAGPFDLEEYTPVSQTPATGSGTAADPYRQATAYAVTPAGGSKRLEVEQTTTYVNGSQQFSLRWAVTNVSDSALSFKALVAADFHFDGSDRGTGIYTDGPPRFIGGTNADTGNSGGFAEVSGGQAPPWSAYQALEFGRGPDQVWGKIQAAAQTPEATFDDSVIGNSVDNAGGVEWDHSSLAPGQTRSFELRSRSAVPTALQLTPSNAGAPQGVPVLFTATAVNTDGVPYQGKMLRYTITGANPRTASATLDPNGQATISDPGVNAGDDTLVAYVDFNTDGMREATEPQGSALATFVENVPPSCVVKISGDRPGGGGAGKPLVITVACSESATVTTATTLRTVPRRSRNARAAARITLKTRTTTVAPGRSVPIKIVIPRSVARRYAGRTLVATIAVTAKDAAGNVARVKKSKRIRLATINKHRRHR